MAEEKTTFQSTEKQSTNDQELKEPIVDNPGKYFHIHASSPNAEDRRRDLWAIIKILDNDGKSLALPSTELHSARRDLAKTKVTADVDELIKKIAEKVPVIKQHGFETWELRRGLEQVFSEQIESLKQQQKLAKGKLVERDPGREITNLLDQKDRILGPSYLNPSYNIPNYEVVEFEIKRRNFHLFASIKDDTQRGESLKKTWERIVTSNREIGLAVGSDSQATKDEVFAQCRLSYSDRKGQVYHLANTTLAWVGSCKNAASRLFSDLSDRTQEGLKETQSTLTKQAHTLLFNARYQIELQSDSQGPFKKVNVGKPNTAINKLCEAYVDHAATQYRAFAAMTSALETELKTPSLNEEERAALKTILETVAKTSLLNIQVSQLSKVKIPSPKHGDNDYIGENFLGLYIHAQEQLRCSKNALLEFIDENGRPLPLKSTVNKIIKDYSMLFSAPPLYSDIYKAEVSKTDPALNQGSTQSTDVKTVGPSGAKQLIPAPANIFVEYERVADKAERRTKRSFGLSKMPAEFKTDDAIKAALKTNKTGTLPIVRLGPEIADQKTFSALPFHTGSDFFLASADVQFEGEEPHKVNVLIMKNECGTRIRCTATQIVEGGFNVQVQRGPF